MEQRVLIAFDDIIADIISNKTFHPVVTELFIKGGNLIISFLIITKLYFLVPKNVRLNTTKVFVMKIKNSKRFNKLLLIIRLVLTSKTSWIYTESALQKKKKKKQDKKKTKKTRFWS